ncbi:hypothetical protein B0I35DRAFT_483258 [Stachybotrys elegans]|uniref:Uncharacterized protein n=1 Tax=Stachybotrys elegans TaxID=80388 RepID=A0A8K0SH06_9HYPO|nr:hypothetical protein B0I35DRAFT_483258 [Stachybotrys elegans]
MAPPATASAPTPAVSRDGFSFVNGEFFAITSADKQHRRATPVELDAHFASGTDKDHPAHWFEAQLLHYGLPPSKTKSVARMRLWDAAKAGSLVVPDAVAKLQTKLKNEWAKNDREMKKLSKSAPPAAPPKSSGTKRKADDSPAATAKKAKPTAIKPPAAKPAASKPAASKPAASKPSASASASATNAGPKQPKKQPATSRVKKEESKAVKIEAPPAPKAKKASAKPIKAESPAPSTRSEAPVAHFARRGGISQGPSRGAATTAVSSPARPRTKQTARRSGAFVARGRIPAPARMEEYPDYDDENGGYDSDRSENLSFLSDFDGDGDDMPDDLAPLGLLNGDYDIRCPGVADGWDMFSDGRFELVLTLEGSKLWGRFDLGIVSGVLKLPSRPWDSSHEELEFLWRGRENEGPIIYGDDNTGSIAFLGDGKIQGQIYTQFGNWGFRGLRVASQGTASRISSWEMKRLWDQHSEEEYERKRVARWR